MEAFPEDFKELSKGAMFWQFGKLCMVTKDSMEERVEFSTVGHKVAGFDDAFILIGVNKLRLYKFPVVTKQDTNFWNT